MDELDSLVNQFDDLTGNLFHSDCTHTSLALQMPANLKQLALAQQGPATWESVIHLSCVEDILNCDTIVQTL